MLDWRNITPILALTLFLWIPAAVAVHTLARGKLPRLAVGVLLGALVGAGALWTGDFEFMTPKRTQIAEYRHKQTQDRKTLESTGVTPTALQEFDEQTWDHLKQLEQEAAVIGRQNLQRLSLSVVYPILFVTLFAAGVLKAGPIAWGISLAAVFSAAVISASAAAYLIRLGWVQPQGVGPWLWGIGLAAGCAATVVGEGGREIQIPDRLWRWLNEPLLYAVSGFYLAIYGQWDLWLILLVLILFGDGKGLGGFLAGWVVRKRGFAPSVGQAVRVSSGGALPLAVALGLFVFQVIDAPLFTALVLANLITAVLVRPMLWMVSAAP